MKPQKKATVAQKAPKSPTIANKRRTLNDKLPIDTKNDKKLKKIDKTDEVKKKLECEKKRLERFKKIEEKKKLEDSKKREKIERIDDKKKLLKDMEKKIEAFDEKKVEKSDKTDDSMNEGSQSQEKKKSQKSDDKQKQEKQSLIDVKKKFDKFEEKKKIGKEETSETASMPNSPISEESKSEEKVEIQVVKKKLKDEKKKDCKGIKSDCKETKSNAPTKDKKIDKKLDISKKPKAPVVKKDNKPKKLPAKKTVVAKKCPLSKKLIEKKLKLVKSGSSKEDNSSPEDSDPPKSKKKNLLVKSKIIPEKKPKLAKQMKAKLPPKNGKLNNVLKKEKLKKITEKIVKKKLDIKETDKTQEPKKIPDDSIAAEEIKKELPDDEESAKPLEPKKSPKLPPKSKAKKPTKKQVKPSKSLEDDDKSSPKPEDLSVKSEDTKSPSAKKDRPESPPKLDLKQEMTPSSSGSDSPPSSTDSDHDYVDASERRNKQKKRQDRDSSPNDERARRMRLFGFWSGPKRHRVASLNALAKVHCLYENEAGGVYLGGFCKPKPEKDKSKKPPPVKDDKEKEEPAVRKETKDKKPDVSGKTETDNTSKRNLRNVPGLRGKHWDMMECTSSSSSSSDDDNGDRNDRNVKRGRKKNTTRRKKPEEVMDLKDMVVCKRMASLNASAILAASYSDEKNRQSSSDESEESESSEVEIIKRRKHIDNDGEKRKGRQINDEDVLKPGKKVVIVNQDTDVTITGVYVNQTRSTHHEGFCSIAGMQYRISSTSHTQTAATAVATELHEQKVEQPCKSYTPLGALSSMQPPGSQGSHPNMSPRRHSAFSAPHQHGYYQPAGPLIQHPPTLPPVKGPPPEPTPTPPQNSEGSDDLVATSTTSGGTNSTGNTWRSYPKSESRLTTTAIPSTSILPTGGGFYRAYCPQYYGTPPQYQELCYPPTYPHPHSHPPPYYKYAPAYRRQYYSYPESGGGAGGPSVPTGAPVVEYQPPPPPGDYPMPPYYGGYPPPPPPPPPPPNPAYLHAQGRALVDHATFQGCPCPMQSCSKNVDTGPLIGNGKGAPVASGPGLSLPPSALVGPPSPARGLAGLAPPHGANAWDTDRVQLNTIRNLNHSQSITTVSNNNNKLINNDNNCISVIEKLDKCTCTTKLSCTSTCEVKQETLSPNDNTTELQKTTTNIQLNDTINNYKIENNNVKCESCSVVDNVLNDNITNKLSSSSSLSSNESSSSGTSSCTANCNVKCEENNYKCELIKCEECIKEGQIAILEIDKDSGILLIDDKIDDNSVKEEINDVGGGGDDGGGGRDNDNWNKPDYEATVDEQVDDEVKKIIGDLPNCGRVGKRKLSLDSLSDSPKKKKVDKRTLSVGSTRDDENGGENRCIDEEIKLKKKSQVKRKAEDTNLHESNLKKMKNGKNGVLNCLKNTASETSIMETINNVIQQSLLMTKKKESKTTVKCKDKPDVKKKSVNLISIIKKVPKTIVNAVVNDKLQLKTEGKLIKDTGLNKCESKIKGKVFDGKNKCHNKIKNNNNNKINDVKINDLKINEFDIVDNGIGNFDGKYEDTKRVALGTRKKKSTKKGNNRKNGKNEENNDVSENFILVKRPFLKPKWSNGWSWEGESYEAKVYLTNEESAIRRCYAAMRHVSGDVLRPRDCVLLKSGQRKADLPFVAKIAALWENPDDGEMMFSLLWYYRPEHTEQGRTDYDTEDEVFASRHRDANSVACIEDKCYILTFNEYCRYRKNLRRMEEGLECPGLIVPPGDHKYPRESRQPPIPVPSDMVLFCRRVYDYRGKKLVKNPG